MRVDISKWSGEGAFTQTLVDRLQQVERVVLIRVEDAPASRSEADYNFISNEIFVEFAAAWRLEPARRYGFLPATKKVMSRAMTIAELEGALSALPQVGQPDYSDEGMLQYLRSERIIPPYQTRGYKIVELVRIYEAARGRADS